MNQNDVKWLKIASNDAKKTKKWQGASVDAESRQLSNPMYEDED